MAAAVAVAVVILAVGAIAARSDRSPPIQVGGARMVPRVSAADGRAEFSISLPTGQRYIVSTPVSLDIASLGATAYVSITWDGHPDPSTGTCCDRVIRFRYASTAELFPDTEPATELSASAQVFERGASDIAVLGPSQPGGWIVLPRGRWSALVAVATDSVGFAPLSVADQKLLATNFHAEVGTDGFPVLQLEPPLHADAHTAGISFGDSIQSGQRYLLLSPFFCGDPGSHTSEPRYSENNGVPSVAWCEPDTGLLVLASGPESFVHAVADGLQTRPN